MISMKNVVKRYGNHTALDHLSLELQKGEILGLLGPNGAGKTTAIRALTGLTGIDSGEILLFGKTMRSSANEIKNKLGVVPQDLALYETLSARDNLEFFGKLYGIKGAELKRRADETLEILGLTDVARKAPGKFSGGMKRRLNIGCAIIHKPELLILDEPTVGIDPQSRNHILSFVSEINRQGTTVLYTSHYMEEIERLCSRVSIMDTGRVIANGSVDELAKSVVFEEITILEVKKPSPALSESIRKIQGVKACEIANLALTITSEANSQNIARILEVAQPYIILGVSAKRPTLEDAFLSLTGKKLRDGGDS